MNWPIFLIEWRSLYFSPIVQTFWYVFANRKYEELSYPQNMDFFLQPPWTSPLGNPLQTLIADPHQFPPRKSIRFFIIDGLMFNDKRYFSKFQAWHQYGIPCEQLFLSCMAFSVYEVVRVAAWLVCGVVGLFTRGVNKSTTRLTCDLVFFFPFCFGDEGKSKKKKRLIAG